MANLEKYMDLQADFYHYMVEFGGIAKKTSCDYVTRMKFLAHDYALDETLTQEKIDEILRQEDLKRQERTVENDNNIKATEKDSIVKSRIGQGIFRNELIAYWHGCAISQCPFTWMLIASHIKPWRDADNQERLDTYNGLLLLPNYDKLFDLGYISFTQTGKIMYSRLLDKFDREAIGLTSDLHLVKLENQHLKYLKYHNENCFLL